MERRGSVASGAAPRPGLSALKFHGDKGEREALRNDELLSGDYDCARGLPSLGLSRNKTVVGTGWGGVNPAPSSDSRGGGVRDTPILVREILPLLPPSLPRYAASRHLAILSLPFLIPLTHK